jgi:hypothetical protein
MRLRRNGEKRAVAGGGEKNRGCCGCEREEVGKGINVSH